MQNVTQGTDITQPGFAADARMMNPAVDGSIAGKVEGILSFPRIRKLVNVSVAPPEIVGSNGWQIAEVSISQYGFRKMPHAFIGQTGWHCVHSIELVGTDLMRVTIMNPYRDPQKDHVSIVLIELM